MTSASKTTVGARASANVSTRKAVINAKTVLLVGPTMAIWAAKVCVCSLQIDCFAGVCRQSEHFFAQSCSDVAWQRMRGKHLEAYVHTPVDRRERVRHKERWV